MSYYNINLNQTLVLINWLTNTLKKTEMSDNIEDVENPTQEPDLTMIDTMDPVSNEKSDSDNDDYFSESDHNSDDS